VNLMQVVIAAVAANDKRGGPVRRDLLFDALIVMDMTGKHQVGHAPGITNGVFQRIGHLGAAAVKYIEGVDRMVQR